jgi:hypothetical protein
MLMTRMPLSVRQGSGLPGTGGAEPIRPSLTTQAPCQSRISADCHYATNLLFRNTARKLGGSAQDAQILGVAMQHYYYD